MIALKLDGELYYVTFEENAVKAIDRNGWCAGKLTWAKLTKKITSVYVESANRRRGVATALLKLAREREPIRHSNDRSDKGEAWARSLGERLPKRSALTILAERRAKSGPTSAKRNVATGR